MSRLSLRWLGALICAGVAGVYALIGLEVVTVAEESEAGGDIAVFGFGAAAIFLVGAVLLLTVDRKPVWVVGAVLQVMIIAMYFAVGGDRTPSFEAWGLGLRVPQLALLAILVALVLRPARSSAGEGAVAPDVVEDFLAQRRLVVVGATDESSNFGRTIYRELRDRGYEATAVSSSADEVAGDRTYPDLAAVPGPIDGVVVMVHRDRAVPVVREAIELGIPRVWLFKGVGGAGSTSPEAVELCRSNGVAVVPGACPLMFLSPVAAVHRIHRGARHLNGSLARTA
ncbi:MAG: CoA-binding protein [Acidimicrobiales bacterium]